MSYIYAATFGWIVGLIVGRETFVRREAGVLTDEQIEHAIEGWEAGL